jgi:RimJ/RimL family protein N-acetyltransferase
MLPVTLTSDLVRLDLPMRSDVAAITEACQDEAVQEYTTVPSPYRESDARRFVDALVGPGWASGETLTWAVRRPDSTWLQGVISFRMLHHDIGFWLAPWARGSGLMTEATRLVVDYAHRELAQPEVYWECFVGNIGSAAVARRTGFVYTGDGEGLYPYRDGSPAHVWKGLHHAEPPLEPVLEWPADSYGAQ